MQITPHDPSARGDRADRRDRRDRPDPVGELAHELETNGLHGALAYLNGRTRFRYTGVYAQDGGELRTVALFDRENPAFRASGARCPMDETYCEMTVRTEAPLDIEDAATDPRLTEHPARLRVLSYSGVPLRTPGGKVWGSICHHDVRPRLLSEAERTVLASSAPIVARWVSEARTDTGA